MHKAPNPHRAGALGAVHIIDSDNPDSKLSTVRATLGRGYNSFTRTELGDCVSGTAYGSAPGKFAPSYTIQEVKSYEQFKSETSAEASLSGDFPAFSASIKASFESSSESKTTTEFLLVRERLIADNQINLDNAKLTVPFPTDPTRVGFFYRRCGDRYVSNVQMGGEYMAMTSFISTSDTSSTVVDVESSGGSLTISASASFNSKVEALKTQTRIQVRATQLGGGGVDMLPSPSIDEMLEYARAFPAQIKPETAAPIAIETQSYLNLNVDIPDLEQQHEDYEQVEALAFKVSGVINDLKALQATMAQYDIPNPPMKNDIADITRQNLEIESQAYPQMLRDLRNCAEGFWIPAKCTFDPALMSYRLPVVGTVIVKEIDTKNKAWQPVRVPYGMRVEFRGTYCPYGNDDECWKEGNAPLDRNEFAMVQANNQIYRYVGAPIAVTTTPVFIGVRDDDDGYGDNHGPLYVVLY